MEQQPQQISLITTSIIELKALLLDKKNAIKEAEKDVEKIETYIAVRMDIEAAKAAAEKQDIQ